ncbi:MAG: IS21 family transposase [Peptococcaceae bacterium]|nr:IS21 family transposase [Peptococcaceae bacterium]
MNIYEQIRHLYAVEKLSQRAIARKLGISRNTVKRYCNGENVPWESKPRQYECPVTGPIRLTVQRWLEEDKQAPKKQRHTATRVHERLVEEYGFTGSYSAVRDLVRELRSQEHKAYIPLEFDPGEAAQVDWGEATVYLNGKKVKVQLFCYRLCSSSAPYVAVFPSQRSESFLAGHVQAFEFLGGVPKRLIYDNLKTAVKEGWGRYVRAQQPAFLALRSHYAFSADFCNPGAGNEKGLVEGLVGYIRRNVLVPVPRVNDFAELQPLLDERCRRYQKKQLRYHQSKIKDALAVEQQYLTPLPARQFDYALTSMAEVDNMSLVKFDRNRYSVPVDLVGKPVTVKGYPYEVKIYHRSRKAAVHHRIYRQGETSLVLEHYLPVLVQKPRSLQNAAPLRWASLPPGFAKFKDNLLARGETKELARVLKLVMDYGIEEVEKAVLKALDSNQYSYQAIYYYLTTRQVQPAKTNTLPTFPRVQPVDLTRYDSLWAGETR